MLQKVANFYESEVDATVKGLTSIMEPLMIVVVGGIIIAMYLPMFKIFELIE
jgi:type IV pilus assembly protein PilC